MKTLSDATEYNILPTCDKEIWYTHLGIKDKIISLKLQNPSPRVKCVSPPYNEFTQ